MKQLFRDKRIILFPIAAVALITVGFGIAQLSQPSTNPIPSDVMSGLKFTPLIVPQDNSRIRASHYALGPADNGTRPLSFELAIDDQNVSVTETQLPAQFNEIPEYKERFIDTFITGSESIGTGSGTIYFGRPAKANGYSHVGIMFDRGLLTIFSLKSGTLTQDEWRRIGDALVAAKE